MCSKSIELMYQPKVNYGLVFLKINSKRQGIRNKEYFCSTKKKRILKMDDYYSEMLN